MIKDSERFIQFVFITGVSKFSRVNLFSGLNSLFDITLDPRFSAICGYTQKELEFTFKGRCYILEFKVKELSSGNRALEQLKEKKYHEKYVNHKSMYLGSGEIREIYLVGVELNKTDRNITDFAWERVL